MDKFKVAVRTIRNQFLYYIYKICKAFISWYLSDEDIAYCVWYEEQDY